jgi:hypothetical protein
MGDVPFPLFPGLIYQLGEVEAPFATDGSDGHFFLEPGPPFVIYV